MPSSNAPVAHVIGLAAHWWVGERSERGIDTTVGNLFGFLFTLADALYATVGQFPDTWSEDITHRMTVGGKYGLVINIHVTPLALAQIRGAIGLAGDMFCVAKRLRELDTQEAEPAVRELHESLEVIREARNFFAHLDEHLGNLDKHGITGEAATSVGIQYTPTSVGNFHLVLSGNTLHFTRKGHSYSLDVGRKGYAAVFSAARHLYAVLTAHSTHHDRSEYPSADSIYITA